MPAHQPFLEVPIFTPSSGLPALTNGASRLELNAPGSYRDGGTTPSTDTLAAVISATRPDKVAPIRIMIRPRGAPADGAPDFIYTPSEFAAMQIAIAEFKASGLMRADVGDGFVFGILAAPDVVDLQRNKQLVDLGAPYPCVFHRAFDSVLSWNGEVAPALDAVVACGFQAVLTSGGMGRVTDEKNVERLEELVQLANGRIEVVIGGGVRRGNLRGLKRRVCRGDGDGDGVVWFHTSCLTGGLGEGEGKEEMLVNGEEVAGIWDDLRRA